MRFHLSDSGTLSLREPMDFKRLDVLIDPQPPEAVERAISRIGRRESDTHVRLAPSVLRFVSGGRFKLAGFFSGDFAEMVGGFDGFVLERGGLGRSGVHKLAGFFAGSGTKIGGGLGDGRCGLLVQAVR